MCHTRLVSRTFKKSRTNQSYIYGHAKNIPVIRDNCNNVYANVRLGVNAGLFMTCSF